MGRLLSTFSIKMSALFSMRKSTVSAWPFLQARCSEDTCHELFGCLVNSASLPMCCYDARQAFIRRIWTGRRGGGEEEAHRKVLSSVDVSPKVEEEVTHLNVAMRCGTHERCPSLEWEG